MRRVDTAHHGGGQSGPGGGGAGMSGKHREDRAERTLPTPVAGAGPLAAFQRGARHVRAGAARAPRGSRAPPAGRCPPARPEPSRGGGRDGHTRGTDAPAAGTHLRQHPGPPSPSPRPVVTAAPGRMDAQTQPPAHQRDASSSAAGGRAHTLHHGRAAPPRLSAAPGTDRLAPKPRSAPHSS